MRIFIKPVEGCRIRDPFKSDIVPQEGRSVEKNSYWIRRLNEGSVTLVQGDELKDNSGGVKK